MLYITTRGNRDAYTSHRALCNDVAPDGGRYIPFKMPRYSEAEIIGFQMKSFGQGVAEILNAFFSAGITGMDVDFCIGKNSVKMSPMSHRICVAEMWHNLAGNYESIVNGLNKKVHGEDVPSVWFKTAVRISMLFALYGEMLRQDLIEPQKTFDISVDANNFAEPIAAIYAREMGLPIGTIICTSVENGILWDVIHRGSFAPAADSDLALGLEQLLFATLGQYAVKDYISAYRSKSTYSVNDVQLAELNRGLFCSVVGKSRVEATINSVYRSNQYLLDASAALCYGGLQDYRAKTGSTSITLLFSNRTPSDFVDKTLDAAGSCEK